MNKPDLIDVARQTWQQMRRLPTGDALADAVLLNALYGLLRTPAWGVKSFLTLGNVSPSGKWHWLWLPIAFLENASWLFWKFNLSLRLREGEEKAWRTTIVLASTSSLLITNALLMGFLFRKEPRELRDEQQKNMTDKQKADYKVTWTKYQDGLKENPWKPFVSPTRAISLLISFAFALNILFRALQPSTRARFHRES